MNYWLIKSEPESYSIYDLQNKANQTDTWEGIRNYQVRNMIRDDIELGDVAFFYHSSCKVPAIVGSVSITKTAYPDKFALDPNSKYYDARSSINVQPWLMFDVKLKKIFNDIIPLKLLKESSSLQDMKILQKGNRLSITKITEFQYSYINKNFVV